MVNILKVPKFNKNIAIHPEASISHFGIIKNHLKPENTSKQHKQQKKRQQLIWTSERTGSENSGNPAPNTHRFTFAYQVPRITFTFAYQVPRITFTFTFTLTNYAYVIAIGFAKIHKNKQK